MDILTAAAVERKSGDMNYNTLRSVYIECISVFERDNYFSKDVNVLGTATGFYYKYRDRMFLVTNKHVVNGKNVFSGENISNTGAIPTALRTVVNYEIVNYDDSIEYFETTFVYELYDDLQSQIDKRWYEYKDNSMIDVAIIDVTEQYYNSIEIIKEIRKCKNCDWYHYAYNDKLNMYNVTDNIFVVGFPFGYKTTGYDGWYALWNNGTIASEYEKQLAVPIDAMISDGKYTVVDAFLIDSKTWRGQSGSPVLVKVDSETFDLIGIYSGRTNEESSLGYVWKMMYVNEIIYNICDEKL